MFNVDVILLLADDNVIVEEHRLRLEVDSRHHIASITKTPYLNPCRNYLDQGFLPLEDIVADILLISRQSGAMGGQFG